MRKAFGLLVWIVGLAAALAIFDHRAYFLAAFVGAITVAVAWEIGRCHHADPILLPASLDLVTGRREAARWRCDACGREWAVRK